MGRAPCCDKANVKRGPWSPEEDAALRSYLEANGTGGNWIALPQKAGLRRCGKSCRLRWLNYLRPDIKHGGFTEEEDNVIYTLFKTIGSRWSVIASHLPGRTDNDVKNYWNTKLKKRLMGAAGSTTSPSSSSSSINQLPSPPPSAPALLPLVPSVKTEDFASAADVVPFGWPSSFCFGSHHQADPYRLFSSELPPLPVPAGLAAAAHQPAAMEKIASATPENSSAASSSIDDPFLSDLGFEYSYSEFLSGYGEIAPSALYSSSLVQRITYS